MPAGRPPKYNTPEEMQSAIDEYFTTDAFIKTGDDAVFAPTMSGLAMHLDMTTQALRDYADKDEFLGTVKKAKQRVEVALEQRLHGSNVTGTIFNLKNNFGWKDKQEQEISGPNGGAQEHKWTIEFIEATHAKDEG